MPKNLGGAIVALDGLCLYVVFVCEEVEGSILRINHLFQNGRALLKCRIFIPPTRVHM